MLFERSSKYDMQEGICLIKLHGAIGKLQQTLASVKFILVVITANVSLMFITHLPETEYERATNEGVGSIFLGIVWQQYIILTSQHIIIQLV